MFQPTFLKAMTLRDSIIPDPDIAHLLTVVCLHAPEDPTEPRAARESADGHTEIGS